MGPFMRRQRELAVAEDRCYHIKDDQGGELRVRAGKAPDDKTTKALLAALNILRLGRSLVGTAEGSVWPTTQEDQSR